MPHDTPWIGYANGRFAPQEELRIPAMDRGFLLGDGLFETLRSFGGRAFDVVGHFERMAAGLRDFGIHPPFDAAGFEGIVAELLERNGMPARVPDLTVRITVTRGIGAVGYDLPDPPPPPTVVGLVRPVPDVAQARREGIAAWSSPIGRPRAAGIGRGGEARFVKTSSLAGMVSARLFARSHGATEAVFFDEENRLLEGAASTILAIRGGEILTPPLSMGILAGTTRRLLLAQGPGGRPVPGGLPGLAREAVLTREEVFSAEGLMLASSTLGPVPISSLDGKPFPVDLPAHLRAFNFFDGLWKSR